MKKPPLFCLIFLFLLITSCEKNEFKIISSKNELIETDELANSESFQRAADFYFDKKYSSSYQELYYDVDSKYGTSYRKRWRTKKEIDSIKSIIQKMFLDKNQKALKLHLTIRNNSDQIIEDSHLTVLIRFIFKNDKSFIYIKPYNLLKENQIWDNNEDLSYNLTEVINLSPTDDNKILQIHTPTRVKLEYYLAAKNSIGYNNIEKIETKKDISIGRAIDDIGDAIDDIDAIDELPSTFGTFSSTALDENKMLGFGKKLLSKDITDIWNKKIKNKNAIKSTQIIDATQFTQLENGSSPLDNCFGIGKFKGQAYITFKNSNNTDAVVCLVEYSTNTTIRNEYIQAGSDYVMRQIPSGTYFLKVYYGNDWNLTKKNFCNTNGGFNFDENFSKSDLIKDLIDIENTTSSYTTATITLYKVVNGNMSSENINAQEFFK